MRLTGILAQDIAIRTLCSSIKKNTVSHAYLFAGPRGCGKTSAALAFAAALNCSNPTTDGDACGNCLSCMRIEAGTDADVRLISPDGNQTKIDQMQVMIKDLNYSPLSGKYKVFIVEQADTLNSSSENCILKILEEPPAYAVLILLSRNPNSLLPTIRSRCRFVRFRRANVEEVQEALRQRFDLPDEQIRTIAACSQGAVGAALRMASESRFIEDRQDVLRVLKSWVDGPEILGLQTAEALRDMSKPPKNNPQGQTLVKNLNEKLELVLSWYSDLLSIRVRGESARIINADSAEELASQAQRYSTPHLHECIRTIMDSRRYLEGNITPQLVLENMFFDMRPDL